MNHSITTGLTIQEVNDLISHWYSSDSSYSSENRLKKSVGVGVATGAAESVGVGAYASTLSAAEIATTLKTIGGLVGGGMAAGLGVVTGGVVLGAAVVGGLAYWLFGD